MQIAGPYPIVAGEQATITPPDDQPYAWVVIFNSIETLLEVRYGGNEQWIQPLMANQFKLDSPSTIVNVDPNTTQAAGTALGSITAAWYLTTEPMPTGYPIPITATNVTVPSGTPVTITGQPIDVDVVSTTVVPSQKSVSASVGTGGGAVYSNTTGASQYCTNLLVANAQTVATTVTLSLDGNSATVVVGAGQTVPITLPFPFLIPNNTSITGSTSAGTATVTAITTG